MSNNINENLLDKDKGELQIELKENIVLDEKKEGNIEVVDIAKE